MAKKLIPEELDELIKEFLTDGILTARERGVVLRKAESMGLDVDEIDLYLDAQVQKLEKAAETAKRESKGRTCPFCDGEIPELATKCPHCGKPITAKATSDLKEIIDNLEDALVDLKSGEDSAKSKALVERYSRKARLYYDDNPKVQNLLSEIESETAKAEKKVKSMARSESIKGFTESLRDFSKGVFRFMANHKWLTGIALFFLLCVLFEIIDDKKTSMHEKKAVQAATEAVASIDQAIIEGNLEKALSVYRGYKNKKYSIEHLMPTAVKLAKALIANGDYDTAQSMLETSTCRDDVIDASEINKIIQNEFISVGEYERAEKCLEWGTSYLNAAKKDHYKFVCTCIDQMRKNRDPSGEIKSFIDKMTVYYSMFDYTKGDDEDWSQETVKKRLYEYAGIKK